MEVYINDMVVKRKEKKNQIMHIQESFELLYKHNMKLNLEKQGPSLEKQEKKGHSLDK